MATLSQLRDGLARIFAHQGMRFLALGGFAAAVNWLVRFPLSLFLPFEAAVFVAYMIGMSVGFHLYRRYVFPGSTRPVVQQTLLFLGVNLIGALVVLGVSTALLWAQGDLSIPLFAKEGLAHGLAIGVGAFANFVGHKYVTFATEHKDSGP